MGLYSHNEQEVPTEDHQIFRKHSVEFWSFISIP